MTMALVPDSAALALICEGFANERKTLTDERSKCTDPGLMRFYTERIGLLWSAEGMGCVLMAVAGKFNWECVRNLEAALYLCMVSPDREAMAETRKANADAVAAERQTHNWLWRVFH